MKTKRCPKCGETKSINEFNKNKTKKDGLQSQCKKCVNKYYKKRSKKIKKCAKCEEWKPFSEFYKERKSKNGYGSWCKKCHTKYSKKYEKQFKKEPEIHKNHIIPLLLYLIKNTDNFTFNRLENGNLLFDTDELSIKIQKIKKEGK